MNRKVAIVPAYNEAAAIAKTVAEIRQNAPEFAVLVVDDGSTDATAELAAAAGALVVRLPYNLGIGGAMQTGYLYVFEHNFDVAVQIDADGQHDPSCVGDLLTHLETNPEIDMVVGSRFLDYSGEGFRSSASRRAGIRIFASLLSLITGRPVTDPTSGFRMTNRRAIQLFASDYPHDYPEVEAILMIHAHRLSSAEVPVQMRPRATGRSTIHSWRALYYMLKVLLAIFIGLLRRPQLGPQADVSAGSGPETLKTRA